MNRNTEPLLSELLVRWHRWSVSRVRVADSQLEDFGALVSRLSPRRRDAVTAHAAALATMQDRNARAGAAVWSSPRANVAGVKQARAALLLALEPDHARWFGKALVQLNERGNRIGESNPMAEVSDHDVDLCRELRAEGHSLSWLAEKFEVSKSTVAWWCNGGRRGQVPVRVKEVG